MFEILTSIHASSQCRQRMPQSRHMTCTSVVLVGAPMLSGQRYHLDEVFVAQTAQIRARFAAGVAGGPQMEPSSSESAAPLPCASTSAAAATFSSICCGTSSCSACLIVRELVSRRTRRRQGKYARDVDVVPLDDVAHLLRRQQVRDLLDVIPVVRGTLDELCPLGFRPRWVADGARRRLPDRREGRGRVAALDERQAPVDEVHAGHLVRGELLDALHEGVDCIETASASGWRGASTKCARFSSVSSGKSRKSRLAASSSPRSGAAFSDRVLGISASRAGPHAEV